MARNSNKVDLAKKPVEPPSPPREPTVPVERPSTPTPPDHITFLAAEQAAYLAAIPALEDGKRKNLQLLFLLSAAFLAFIGAPYQIDRPISSEKVVFYTFCGLALCATLIFHSLRMLDGLGRAVRRRAFLYQAICTNRAWVMRNHPEFFVMTVFPRGSYYEEEKTVKHKSEGRSPESPPNRFVYNLSTTTFVALIQLVFVLGAVYFVSLLITATQTTGETFPQNQIGGLNLLQVSRVEQAFFYFYAPIMLWVQFVCNACAHYQQAVWEAKRLCAERPNPVFRTPPGRIKAVGQWTVAAFLSFGVIVTLAALAGPWAEVETTWRAPVVSGFWAATMLIAFFATKIVYAEFQIRSVSQLERVGNED